MNTTYGIGQLVRYLAREGEPPAPALVMRIWEDGMIELYVFHFESFTHIRAAHPSQVEAVESNNSAGDVAALDQRINLLENELDDLKRSLRTEGQFSIDRPEPIVVPDLMDVEELVDSTPAPESDHSPEPEPELVLSNRKKKSAWPG
jgi:hypothetical protein